jgi:hypothetical protein
VPYQSEMAHGQDISSDCRAISIKRMEQRYHRKAMVQHRRALVMSDKASATLEPDQQTTLNNTRGYYFESPEFTSTVYLIAKPKEINIVYILHVSSRCE